MTLLELKEAINKLDAPDDTEVVMASDGFGYSPTSSVEYDHTFDLGVTSEEKLVIIS